MFYTKKFTNEIVWYISAKATTAKIDCYTCPGLLAKEDTLHQDLPNPSSLLFQTQIVKNWSIYTKILQMLQKGPSHRPTQLHG